LAAQLTLKPSNSIDVGLNYAHSYHDLNILGLGLSRFSSNALNIPGRTVNADGTVNLGGFLNTPVNVDSVGATLTWRFAPKIAFTGYGAYFFVDSAAGPEASSNFSAWMAGLYFQDLLNNITPGAFVLFNPEGNSNNDTTLVGVLRTTFTF
jgi:hypothetical protein